MPFLIGVTPVNQGPLIDKIFVDDVATNDYELDDGKEGFLVQVTTPGSGTAALQYETATGTTNTETGLSAGDVISCGGIPVLVRKILAAGTTVSEVAVGRG